MGSLTDPIFLHYLGSGKKRNPHWCLSSISPQRKGLTSTQSFHPETCSQQVVTTSPSPGQDKTEHHRPELTSNRVGIPLGRQLPLTLLINAPGVQGTFSVLAHISSLSLPAALRWVLMPPSALATNTVVSGLLRAALLVTSTIGMWVCGAHSELPLPVAKGISPLTCVAPSPYLSGRAFLLSSVLGTKCEPGLFPPRQRCSLPLASKTHVHGQSQGRLGYHSLLPYRPFLWTSHFSAFKKQTKILHFKTAIYFSF